MRYLLLPWPRAASVLALIGACALGGACGDDGGGGVDGGGVDGATRIPLVHRPAPTTCPAERGAGNGDPLSPDGACAADADCTEGVNGRCLASRGGALIYSCSYDDCAMDSECSAGSVCDCRPDGSSAAPNRCLGGDCVVDADCGAGGYCSPTVAFDAINYPYVGYYCRRAGDTCVDDADCTDISGVCAFDMSVMHWACSAQGFYPP